MSFAQSLPNHLRPPPRQAVHGRAANPYRQERPRPRDVCWRRVARRKGEITRAAVDIFRALLFKFANLTDGRCFPSYERIAEEAGCVPRTVGRCLPDLEAAGLVTWVNRIQRVRERVAGLGGIWASVWRVIRTSNAYDFPLIAKQTPAFVDKGQKSLGTAIQVTSLLHRRPLDPETPLGAALLRLGKTLGAVQARPKERMRSRFAAFSACANCAPSGRGRTDAQGASKKGAWRGRGVAARSRLNDFEPDSGKGGSAEDAGSATRRDAINPAHPCGFPRRFAVPSAGFDYAALCGVLKLSGRRASRQVSTACGASNKRAKARRHLLRVHKYTYRHIECY